jgi:transcriptional regulator with XRE-family HTH domain
MFEPLSDIIRMRRKQLNLTQEKLAKMAKVSRRQLSLLEDGHNVSLLFLTKIADVLELTDIPVGRLRIFTAPPELAALVRAAEAIQILKQAGDTWRSAAQTIDDSASTLDALILSATQKASALDNLKALIGAAADRLAHLPPWEGNAAETLRMLAGSEPASPAPASPSRERAKPAAGADSENDPNDDSGIWPR